jgi:uncharacterized protein (DUF486 family)
VNTTPAAPQSTFVTVLAWLAICLNGFGVAIALMQNVMVNFLMPTMIANSPQGAAAAFPLSVFRVLALLFLAILAFMTYAGYGLLKRRNWARRTFVVVCALGIAWSALCMLMFALGFGLGRFPPSGPAAPPPNMKAVFTTVMVMTSVLTIGMCILFGWIIKRLRSATVRAEFS